ncbi:MAG: heavy metal-binding domain-containing protein [Vicinamibacteria bacterium]
MRPLSTILGLAPAALAASVLAQDTSGDEIIWTCPTHREETGVEEGVCPQCDHPLVQARVRVAWSCPRHAVVIEPKPGECPICERDLYPISQEVAYVCPMHAEIVALEAGICSLCRMALAPKSSARPHQDHNPKHGGVFFMAPDAWHHLEGTYPEEGTFRVYLFDNFSRPLSAKAFRGRAVLKETLDPVTREVRELVTYPLLSSRDGGHLEARVGSGSLPREITAKVQLEKEGPFERFDFVFAALSTDSDIAPDRVAATLVVPDAPDAIATAILERRDLVRALLERGGLNEIYIPALEAKDLAIALEAHLAEAPDRASLTWALKELVRAAWLLDEYGDRGNREKVESAYRPFDEAANEIASLFGVLR